MEQWTTETIILAATISALVVGFLIASLSYRRHLSLIEKQFENDKEKLTQDLAESQSKVKEAQDILHESQITNSKLEEQLRSARVNEERLESLNSNHEISLKEKLNQLEQSRQNYHHVEKQYETSQADFRSQKLLLEELRQRLISAEELCAKWRNKFEQLNGEHTELKTSLSHKEEHFQQQIQQLSETKQSLTKEFENLANKIFEEKGKTFSQTNQASIDGMLKPFRDQIEGFQKRVNEVHDATIKGNTNLNAEIQKVLDIGLNMSQEASNLTSALKGNSQQRGAWGEAQLRRTLEMSGLIENAHYEAQSSFKDADGKQKQTDYLVKLPDGKHIIIDSKVSLIAYDKAVSADSPEEYQLSMDEHVKSVRKHIDDLSSKDYTNLIGVRSPGFVLMFMPIEPAYIEALKNNKDLFEYGYKKNIVLVSHTTLIPILRTVSNLWMVERSNSEAREISEKAGDIYNQVCLIAERLSKLGGSMNSAKNHYNDTVTALVGQQGLYGKVERFSQLSVKANKTLPKLEPAHMDFENERLSVIVEPLDKPENQLEDKQNDSDS